MTIARGLSDTFAGIRPGDVPAFVVAQLAGAGAASLVAGWLFAGPGGEVVRSRLAASRPPGRGETSPVA